MARSLGKFMRGVSRIAMPAALEAQKANILMEREKRLADLQKEITRDERDYKAGLLSSQIRREDELSGKAAAAAYGKELRGYAQGLTLKGMELQNKQRKPNIQMVTVGYRNGVKIEEPFQENRETGKWEPLNIRGDYKIYDPTVHEQAKRFGSEMADKIDEKLTPFTFDETVFKNYGGSRKAAEKLFTDQYYSQQIGPGAFPIPGQAAQQLQKQVTAEHGAPAFVGDKAYVYDASKGKMVRVRGPKDGEIKATVGGKQAVDGKLQKDLLKGFEVIDERTATGKLFDLTKKAYDITERAVKKHTDLATSQDIARSVKWVRKYLKKGKLPPRTIPFGPSIEEALQSDDLTPKERARLTYWLSKKK